jgi:ABC-type thiamine transport system substrate-binding protein
LKSQSTKADIVLGLDTNLTAEAKQTGLFAPHGPIGELNLPGAGRTIHSFPTITAISLSSTTPKN